MASYKHYDVLLVNAMFDGMNLVAKEGPLVNEHNGVSVLSENTGAHEELGEFALSVNPFDIQETADSIHAALTMSEAERERRANGLQADRHGARPGSLDRRSARRHRHAPRSAGAGAGRLPARRRLSYSTPNSSAGARHGAGSRRAGGAVAAGSAERVTAVGAARRREGRLRMRLCFAGARERRRVGAGRRARGAGSTAAAGAVFAGTGAGSGSVAAAGAVFAGTGAGSGSVAGAVASRTGTAAPAGTSGAGARRRGQATTRAAAAASASARATFPHRTRPRTPGGRGSVSMSSGGPAPSQFAPLPL